MAIRSDNLIYLVEDNPDDVELTLRAFKKSGLLNEIRVLRDGAEAVDVLVGQDSNGSTPAPILLDLKLPKLNGLEVLHLRANRKHNLHVCRPGTWGRLRHRVHKPRAISTRLYSRCCLTVNAITCPPSIARASVGSPFPVLGA